MIDEPTLAGWLEEARSYVDEQKPLHAIQLYRRIIESSPTTEEGWIGLFRIYCHQHQYDTAERLLLDSLEYLEDKNEVVFLLGVLHLQTGDTLRALTYLRQLQRREAGLASEFQARVHFNIALVYVQMHRWGLAEHHLRKTRYMNPDFPKINESLSEILLRRGHVQEVVQLLQESLSKDPYSWMGHYLLGLAFARMLQWRNAYQEFVVAVDMDPKEPRAWQKCGECLIALRELDQAEHYLRKALELNPKFTDAVVNYGYLYFERGERAKASELFEHVLAQEPMHTGAREGKNLIQRSSQTKN